MILDDGTGSGKSAKIDIENKLGTRSVTESEAEHINFANGEAYTLFFPITSDNLNPSAALSSPCILYLKDTSEKNIVITDIRMWAESPEYLDIYFNQIGTPVNGGTITPTNMNLNSGKTADGIFLGADRITGMSGGALFDRLRVPADNSDHAFIWAETIIIPKNKILTIYAGNGGVPIEASISFYFHDIE